MPDGSLTRALPAWPELDRDRGTVDVDRFFGSRAEAADFYDEDLNDLDRARDELARAFNRIREQAEHAKPAVRRVLTQVLNGLIDVDADTCGWVLEKQAAAEEWVNGQ